MVTLLETAPASGTKVWTAKREQPGEARRSRPPPASEVCEELDLEVGMAKTHTPPPPPQECYSIHPPY